MIYQTGVYTSMHDLLGIIKSFLETNSWVINKWESDEQGYYDVGMDYTGAKRLHVKKQAADGTWMYFNLKSVKRGLIFGDYYGTGPSVNGRLFSEIRGIGINGSTGYDAGEKWDEQPGYPVSKGTTKSIGACITELPIDSGYSYHIFYQTDFFTIAVQIGDNRFMFLSFGLLTKSGVYTGGQFYSGSLETYFASYNYWYAFDTGSRRREWRSAFLGNAASAYAAGIGIHNSTLAVYLEVDSVNAWRHNAKEGSGDSVLIPNLQTGVQVPYSRADDVGVYPRYAINFNMITYDRSPNHFNGVSILSPAYIFVRRATERYSLLGRPEGIRVINRSPYNAGDEFSLGDDTWKVFPAFDIADERGTAIINFSSHIGFALLKATS